MGFSLITSEAENFLIWLPSICNLSFVDFLFILFSLTLSLSTSFPHRFSKCAELLFAGPCPGTMVDMGEQDTAKDLTHLGDNTLLQDLTGQSITVRRQLV